MVPRTVSKPETKKARPMGEPCYFYHGFSGVKPVYIQTKLQAGTGELLGLQ